MSRLSNVWKALRGQSTAKRGFSAARIDRITSNWLSTMASINRELQGDLDLLRARGRQLSKDNDYARKFKGMVADNIVGPNGFRYQSRVQDDPTKPDRMANTAIEKAFSQWCAVADVTGRFHFNDMCRTLVSGLPSDGEFLVKIVEGKDAGNKFNFALQVIDVDRIDTQFNGEYGGNTVIMGVEVNQYRRPLAIHIFAAHPNDGSRSSRERIRIPSEDLIHFYNQEYPEQLRGVPWMAPGMLSLHHLGAFNLAALLAAEHGANHYGFFTTPEGAAPAESQDGLAQIMTSVPGVYDTLPGGVTHIAHDSKYPNEVFGPFVKTVLQRIASGWRVAYHSLANDLEGVNYSSIRSGTIEERDRWMTDQDSFIQIMLERIQPRWLRMALLSGAITTPNGQPLPAGKYEKFAAHEWQGRRWQWVDPKSDMDANAMAVMAGWLPPQDIAAQLGYDFDDVLVRISQAQALAKSLGVSLPAYDGKPGANSSQQAPVK
jgi:lambda family phage portal protein